MTHLDVGQLGQDIYTTGSQEQQGLAHTDKISSHASTKSPTLGSSSSSRNQPQSLAQELTNVEDYNILNLKYNLDREGSFTKEGYEQL
ncbi:hypothetical protein RB213_006094 [Colletotrichum asianum]